MTGFLVVVAAVLGVAVFGTRGIRKSEARIQRQPKSKSAPVIRPQLAKRQSTNTDLSGLQIASSFMALTMLISVGLVVLGLVNLSFYGLAISGVLLFVAAVAANRRIGKARNQRVQLRRTAPVRRSESLVNLAVELSPMPDEVLVANDRAWTPVEVPLPKHLSGTLEQPKLATVRSIGAPIEGAELDEILRRRRSAG